MPRCIHFRNACSVVWLLLPLQAHAGRAITATQTTYLERCGGCHGIEGVSAGAVVPDLRDQVGLFLCSAEGRDYMLRVPNVAMSLIRDDAKLAAVMNFVAFQFSGRNRPAHLVPFTADEVHAARQLPLRNTNLAALRTSILGRAIAACPVQPSQP